MTTNAGEPVRLPGGSEVTGLIPVSHQKDASQAKPDAGKRRRKGRPKARPPQPQAGAEGPAERQGEGAIDYLA
jgi:hypothetical protein